MTPAQWQVHSVGGGLALVVQSDLVPEMGTRLVVPVLRASEVEGVLDRLGPVVAMGDEPLRALVPSLTVLPLSAIGPHAFDASAHADGVVRALDMLLSGV